MNFLTEMKLGPRLAGAFAVVVLLLVGTVAFALVRMQAQSASMDRVVRSEVGTLLALMRLETQTQAVSVALRDSILSDKGDVVKAALASVDKTVAEIAESTQQAQQLASAAEKKHLESVVATQAGFVAAVKKVSTTMRSGDNDAAREQLVSEDVRNARKAYVQALTDAVDAQRAETESARASSAAAFSTSLGIILGLAALASAAAVFVAMLLTRSVVRPAREAIAAARRIADGDLTTDIAGGGHDEMGEILGAMRTMQDSLRRIVGQVRVSADNIQVASGEVAAGNGDLSVRTEQTASSLQQTASSMEQLTSTVTQSSDAARQASQLATSAADVAQRGGTVVSQVVATMQDINASSRRINDIIGVIDGIAFQTNILALNAAVEAARAGEQGRGFAVVASEVRSLAQRSAEAAREIKALIGASVDKVESGSKLVADAGSTMGEIVASVQRVADMIGEITAAAGEQREGIGEINGAIGTLDRMTQQNAALVEQSAAAAESLKDQAARLSQAVGAFRVLA